MRNNASLTFKLAGAASILTLSGLMAASPARAETSSAPDAFQHFIECAGWLISDPAKHAQYCDPGHDVFVSGSTGFGDPEGYRG